ncbi:CoA transferase [Advenella sp. S44]|uniref:CaiB/BaiF CoA transferase family protein n=1 Tax=Advenella sp. S44 TaxID=1982755 RepID=UPI000C2B0D06|nr:CoA transferase [Advenella sp. S44]PJX27692.1 CoA transferase [Advenella sp. S44]
MKNVGPLDGIRVIDLTAVVLGPVATQTLADFGAEVIKIESPEGDLMRANGVVKSKGMSSIFLAINRNKKSVSLNLKDLKEKEQLLELIKTADVLVHNMRTTAIKRLGLDYDTIKEANPKLVYCAATGYGDHGDFNGQPAFDDIIQAGCGLASLSGHERGIPEYAPMLLADKIAGVYTANAVLAGIIHQLKTGEGQYIEVPMFETLVAFSMTEHLGGDTFIPPLGEAGYKRLLKNGRKPVPTSNGYAAMLPYTASHWKAFFSYCGRDDLLEKYELNDRHERNKRISELYSDLQSLTVNYSTEELVHICRQLDIPATQFYSIHNITEHPHIKSVNLFEKFNHKKEGEILCIRPTSLFEKTPLGIQGGAPTLGEHNDDYLNQ